jgi:hypothetical protein
MTDINREEIKKINDAIIAQKGYRVNDWLPILEIPTLKDIEEIKGRMSVMNALINIAFEAPTYIIREWIENNNLVKFLSNSEKEILKKENDDLTDFEVSSLSWYLESLWAFLWVTKMIDKLDAEIHVGDNLALLVPNLQKGEDNLKIENIKEIRSEIEIYTMLDYYFRLHWYCVDERLIGKQAKLNEGQIYERRKSLEWVNNIENDWDNAEMST